MIWQTKKALTNLISSTSSDWCSTYVCCGSGSGCGCCWGSFLSDPIRRGLECKKHPSSSPSPAAAWGECVWCLSLQPKHTHTHGTGRACKSKKDANRCQFAWKTWTQAEKRIELRAAIVTSSDSTSLYHIQLEWLLHKKYHPSSSYSCMRL